MRRPNKAILILTSVLLAGAPITSKASSREALWKDVAKQRAALHDLEEKLLAPDPADRRTFAVFLTGPDTGLVRLLPRETGEQALALRGGGAYYSFSRRTHEYGFGSDIELSRGVLSSGFAGGDYGFFEEMGDVALDVVTLDHPAASALASLETPTVLARAREMQSASKPGSSADLGQRLRRVGASVGRAYVVRSVNYGSSDVLVAFRVVSQDDDGSVTLLWKLLKRFPTPELKS